MNTGFDFDIYRFKNGINESIVDHAVAHGLNDDNPNQHLRLAENVLLDEKGGIRKRHGHTQLSTTTFKNGSSATYPEFKQLHSRETELIATTSTELYKRAPEYWSYVDDILSCKLSTLNISNANLNQENSTMGIKNNSKIHAWTENQILSSNDAGVYRQASIGDTVVIPREQLDSAGVLPRCYVENDHATVLHLNNDELISSTTKIDDLSFEDLNRVIVSDVDTDHIYDLDLWRSGNGIAVVAFKNDGSVTGDILSLLLFDEEGNLFNGDFNQRVNKFVVDITALSVASSSNFIGVVLHNGLGGTQFHSFNKDGSVNTAVTLTINSSAVVSSSKLGIVALQNDTFWIVGETGSGVYSTLVDENGTQLEEHTFVPGVSIASKPFTVGNTGKCYFWVSFDTDLQAQYILFNEKLQVEGSVFYGEGGGEIDHLGMVIIDNNVAHWSSLKKGKVLPDVEDGTQIIEAFTDVNVTEVLLELFVKIPSTNFKGELLLGAGTGFVYDGVTLTEHGFLAFPEDISSAEVAGTTSFTSGDVRSYRIHYEKFTAKGNRILSDSVPFTHTQSNTGHDVVLTIPTLRGITRKEKVAIVVYRTVNGGTTYSRVSSEDPSTEGTDNGFLYNDTVSSTVNFTDVMSDNDILFKELDYQNAEFGNEPVGPFIACVSGKRRIFVATDNVVRFSKLEVKGRSVEFSTGNQIVVDTVSGPITGLAVVEQGLIVFKKSHVFLISGEGPTNASSFGSFDFSEPQEIFREMGINNFYDVIVTPGGILANTNNHGVWNIQPAGQHGFVGDKVISFKDESLSAIVNSKNETMTLFFYDSTDRVAVYDYYLNNWVTFTGLQALSAISNDDLINVLLDDGNILVESTSNYVDNVSTYGMKIRCPWFIYNRMGKQQVRRFILAGTYFSPHQIRLTVYRDGKGSSDYSITQDSSTFIDTTSWGEGSWGNGLWGVGEFDTEFIKHRVKHQMCSSISLEIEEIPDDTIFGPAFNLSYLGVEVKTREESARLGNVRNI